MKLIVGLGNPGREYERTRHNVGFDIVDKLADKLKANGFKDKFKGLLTEANVNGEKVYILKPQTYMNLSGDSIIQVVNFYKIDPKKDMVIIYDDMDLPLGKLRIKEKGSAGGHNGIKSIISHMGQDFLRIKCGIGKAQNKGENINFVLGKFSKDEQELIDNMSEDVIAAAIDMINDTQLEKIMQKYNKK
ncbi:MAG: aminoacyl-tRNA hydrolase [Cetobacterium sp.]|uniref:aminoacyl-tRNA hydrolase n=1 Tax=Cetobacterium sp. TaxID=2071632 RepID=UPI003F36A9CD